MSSETLSIYTHCVYFFRTKVTCRQHVADFANIVKAFIGTNYLGLPYAFMQSGLVVSDFSYFNSTLFY